MIKPRETLMSEGQCYFGSMEDPTTVTTCNIWDWDQLRMIKIIGTAKLFPPEEDQECPILARFINNLAPNVRAVTFDDDGLLTAVSTDPEEDETLFVPYPPFSSAESLAKCRTIQYSKLQELDRLGPGVDLSSYEDESGDHQKVAFKFNAWYKPRILKMAWDELNVLSSLPPHPNIVPLDRVVLQDVESRVIGFTTKYIAGGTLENSKVPFRFEWLEQLTQLVDFLNLELGIMHQDIAPRNLLVDPKTNKLLLFDFNMVAHGKEGLLAARDDVTGVVFTLYEVITSDNSFERIPPWGRNMDTVQNTSEWPRHRELDTDVSRFRNFLNEWVATRRSDGDMERCLNAPNQLRWPELPLPDYDIPYEIGKTADGEPMWGKGLRSRRAAIKNGQYCFRWERPPQSRLLKKGESMPPAALKKRRPSGEAKLRSLKEDKDD